MGNVILVQSMSLDGFSTAANVRPEAPMGDGGLQLMNWLSSEDPRDREVLTEGIAGLGAVIAGRRTYDYSVPYWGPNGPSGDARIPVFVVSHRSADNVPDNGVYTFVNSIDDALARAKVMAGEKHISVMGGANIGQEFLKAGLLDEIEIQLNPVLFGSGTRLFDHLGSEHIQLETTKVVQTDKAIHLRFRVVK